MGFSSLKTRVFEFHTKPTKLDSVSQCVAGRLEPAPVLSATSTGWHRSHMFGQAEEAGISGHSSDLEVF